MWVERVVGITRVISPPPPKKKRRRDYLNTGRLKLNKEGTLNHEHVFFFYLSGLELTLNNATIYRKDLKERDGDDVDRETFSPFPPLPYMT